MKTNELISILKTAEQLGHSNLDMFFENGRDGHSDLTKVVAELERDTNQHDPHVYLVFHMDNS